MEKRLDDLVRTERYFTATLLPIVLFHNNLEGVQRFVELVDGKATTEYNKSGKHDRTGTPKNDFEDVEVITEFRIAQELKVAHLLQEEANVEPSEEGEPEHQSVPDIVIVAGQELVVCEGKFFTFVSDWDAEDLNEQLRSQRVQVKLLFQNGQIRRIRAYRHVAIVPFVPKTANNTIDANVVLTWNEIRVLAEKLMGADHYVTVRLRNAVERYNHDHPHPHEKPAFEGKLSFHDMREKCRESGNEIWVGYVGGEAALLKLSLVGAENRKWKWRYPETGGAFDPGNWLSGASWLEIVESTRGFGGRFIKPAPKPRGGPKATP